MARRYGRSFSWRCRACDGLVIDYGPCTDPADSEVGHAERCGRLAESMAAWDAAWEAGE